jgi:hypothetical protein
MRVLSRMGASGRIWARPFLGSVVTFSVKGVQGQPQ